MYEMNIIYSRYTYTFKKMYLGTIFETWKSNGNSITRTANVQCISQQTHNVFVRYNLQRMCSCSSMSLSVQVKIGRVCVLVGNKHKVIKMYLNVRTNVEKQLNKKLCRQLM